MENHFDEVALLIVATALPKDSQTRAEGNERSSKLSSHGVAKDLVAMAALANVAAKLPLLTTDAANRFTNKWRG